MDKVVIGLDLATNTGYSIFKNGELLSYDVLILPDQYKSSAKHEDYPYNFIEAVEYITHQIDVILKQYQPQQIVIEETCASRNVYAQKKIEWLHFHLLQNIKTLVWMPKVTYLGSSKWRSILGIVHTKETKKHNKLVKDKKAKGKITPKHLSVWKANQVYSTTFIQKDNDKADAINLAAALIKQLGELKHDYSEPLQMPENRRCN